MVVHFKDKDPATGMATKDISLRELDDHLEQISTYVHHEGSMFEKVELFWPHELLRVIIHETGFYFVCSGIRIYYARGCTNH